MRTSAAASRPAVRVALISAGTWAIAAAVRNAVIELKREPSPQRDIWDAGLVARPVESPDGVADEAADIQPLPSAPSDAEKYLYVERRKALLLFLSMLSFGGLLASQVRFASSSPGLVALFPLIAFTLIYYVIALVVNLPTRGFDVQEHERLVQSWRPRRYPSVDVFLPVSGEDQEIIANTWNHVAALSYPGRITVYCLDDGADPALERMAARLGFVYLSRPNRGQLKKAGNLKFGFDNSAGDFIVIFDADFCPRSDLLTELMPYFDADAGLGIVQSPQHFRVLGNQDWLERGAGAVQEFFYRFVQVSREYHGGAICVGTNAIYRRAALETNGGPTQIEHSEDVHTGFDLRLRGWRLKYVPVIYAIGVCPPHIPSFVAQQYRWCMGSMSLLGSAKFWKAKQPLRTRLCYLCGFSYYVHTALFTFIGPVIPLLLLSLHSETVRLRNYVWILPGIVYSLVLFPLWHRQSYRLEAWAVKMIYGWAHAFALVDILCGTRRGWQPTGGRGSRQGGIGRRVWWGIGLWGGGVAAAWIGLASWEIAANEWFNFLPILLCGLFYALVVVRSLTSTHARRPSGRLRRIKPVAARTGLNVM